VKRWHIDTLTTVSACDGLAW